MRNATKQYREKNPEAMREYSEQYYKQNKEVCDEYDKQWRKENPEAQRTINTRARLKSKYGLTLEQYQALLNEHNYQCAICGCDLDSSTKSLNPNIDHDHDTGEVRGILCGRCNKAIGLLQDDPTIITNAADYLTKYKNNNQE